MIEVIRKYRNWVLVFGSIFGIFLKSLFEVKINQNFRFVFNISDNIVVFPLINANNATQLYIKAIFTLY